MDARAPNYELAELDYMSGMKYKEIAEKYNVKLDTVKSWKTRYGWNRKSVHTKLEKSVHTKMTNKDVKKEPIVKEVEEVIENTELTDKQRIFLLLLTKCHNATRAYQKAYDCDAYTARVNASRMLTNANIKSEYEKMNQSKLSQIYLNASDIFEKYIDIAFADMGDYVTFGKKCQYQWERDASGKRVPVIDINTGKQKKFEYSYVDLKESSEVDTSIIAEVSEGKNGIKIKRADQMKALDWLSQHMDMATEEQKARLELLQAQRDKLIQDSSTDDYTKEDAKKNIFGILEQMHPVEDGDQSE